MVFETVNKFNNKKFSLLVSRVLNNLPNEGLPIFSEVELTKLESVFEVSSTELVQIINEIKVRFEKAAYLLQNPNDFENSLVEEGFDNEKSHIMSQIWLEQARSLVEKYKGRSLAPQELLDVNWKMGLTLAHSNKSHLKEPIASVEFSVRNNENNGAIENHNIEFNHNELLDFYNVLENIQEHLDSMSK